MHLAQTEQADIVVIGPEVPLVEGLADRLVLSVFAPLALRVVAARLEGSKRFAREFASAIIFHNRNGIILAQLNLLGEFAASLPGGAVVK